MEFRRLLFRSGPANRGRNVLDPRIGGKGDFVQRRDEFRHEDLCEEQRLGIKAERVRFEPPPGDEHVGLALHQPKELTEEDRRAKSDDLAAALEVEGRPDRSEEHTSELQSPMPISYAVFCLKKKKQQ